MSEEPFGLGLVTQRFLRMFSKPIDVLNEVYVNPDLWISVPSFLIPLAFMMFSEKLLLGKMYIPNEILSQSHRSFIEYLSVRFMAMEAFLIIVPLLTLLAVIVIASMMSKENPSVKACVSAAFYIYSLKAVLLLGSIVLLFTVPQVDTPLVTLYMSRFEGSIGEYGIDGSLTAYFEIPHDIKIVEADGMRHIDEEVDVQVMLNVTLTNGRTNYTEFLNDTFKIPGNITFSTSVADGNEFRWTFNLDSGLVIMETVNMTRPFEVFIEDGGETKRINATLQITQLPYVNYFIQNVRETAYGIFRNFSVYIWTGWMIALVVIYSKFICQNSWTKSILLAIAYFVVGNFGTGF
ncbi:MAG TPA: hypothetical protein ENF41_01240 [Candidatus Bathyarchaeota archaeon]|nr:hypothetical protein [Candidatus Bathyarchaeota archaeon]